MSADPIDQACEREQQDTEKAIASARKAASRIEVGFSGECLECGYSFTRIVRGYCGRCRDELKI